MTHQSKSLLAIGLTASLLGGCSLELPLIGNLQDRMEEAIETVETLLPPVKGLILPIKQRLFPQEASTTQHRPSRTHTRQSRPEDTPELPSSRIKATPIPPSYNFTSQPQVRQNMTFDHWRSLGIQRIYEGQTQEAIACFKKALAIRPNDTYIQDWIFAAENPIQSDGQSQTQLPPGLPDLPQ